MCLTPSSSKRWTRYWPMVVVAGIGHRSHVQRVDWLASVIAQNAERCIGESPAAAGGGVHGQYLEDSALLMPPTKQLDTNARSHVAVWHPEAGVFGGLGVSFSLEKCPRMSASCLEDV